MTKILDGKKIRDEHVTLLREKVVSFNKPVKLVIIDIGGGDTTKAYVNQKKKFGEHIGVEVIHKIFIEETETDIVSYIELCNEDEQVHGIIVQLPISAGYDGENIINTIKPEKDVDALTDSNKQALQKNQNPFFVPATARGVIELLHYYEFSFSGKALIIGDSDLTGKPISLLLQRRGMDVDVVNEDTNDINTPAQTSDLLVSATGVPRLVDAQFVHEGQWVVDVGFTVISENGVQHITGDVDFDEVKDIVSAITPVPGGVGPMTVLALFENLLRIPFEI